MKILYYDCFSGISGDMNLGAMVDLGVDPSFLTEELKKLNLQGYTISFKIDKRKGITGTRADIVINETIPPTINSGTNTITEHSHSHDQAHSHAHNHIHLHHPVQQPERNFFSIKDLIEKSTLSDEVKLMSIEIFKKIAIAEAHVHGKTLEEIHFHEVGALDSIIDIVGAAICYNYLKPDKVVSSPVEMGGGTVKCAHGIFPVPAPASLEILKGKPIRIGAVPVEATTPTGAAIISTFADDFIEKIDFKIIKIGYGIGYRDNEIPNVLRVCYAELIGKDNEEQAAMIECNIDDMNPEIYEYVMERLFNAGADDVFFQPIVMKKTRPATKISVLCKQSVSQQIKNILFTETSTLGLREYLVHKTSLQRNRKIIETRWGKVNIKQGIFNDKVIKSKPEYEDCLKISLENNIPLNDVYNEVFKINNQLNN